MGKYKDAYEALYKCVDQFDNEEEKLTPVGKKYKLKTLRLIHQIAAYTERPAFQGDVKTRR